jgi:tetratricopeptide (TPR) repeat protein
MAMGRYQLGLALFYTGDFAAAQTQLEAAITQPSAVMPTVHSLANLHFTLAAIYQKVGRKDDARKELETSIQLEPNDYESNLTLGRLLSMRSDPAAGLPYLEKAAQIQPDSPDVHFFLADAYAQMGRASDAFREHLEAKRLQGGMPPP